MDLSSLSIKPYSDLVIKHPITGEDTDIVVSIYGKDSKQYRDLWQKAIKVAADKKSKKAKDFDSMALDIYVLCTKDWQNVELDGEPLECTEENVRKVYSDERFNWLHDQVIAFMDNRANFI